MNGLSVDPDVFTVLLIFETRPDEAEGFAGRLADFIDERLSRHQGFLAGVVYVTDDQRRVVEFFQWSRPEDWAAYRASEDGREGLFWLQDRHPQVLYLDLSRSVTGTVPG